MRAATAASPIGDPTLLDPLDDYPIHQTPAPLTESSLGSNAYDRYFFNGYAADGSVFFALALGLYPNRRIIDAAFCVLVDGVQHSVFASDRLPHDRRRTAVGPISIEIVEPMRWVRVTVDHPSVGAEALFTARSAPVEEPRFVNHDLPIGVFDYTRYTQFGSWSGRMTAGGDPIDVSSLVGCRDRSWGQRGGRGPDAPPVEPQFFWLWTPINFDDGAVHLDVNEHADGRRWHQAGFIVPALEPEPEPWRQPVEAMAAVDYELELESGTRWMRAARLALIPWRAEPVTVELTPRARFQMSAVGYGHPRYRHGTWHGEGLVAEERSVVADVDPNEPASFHVQHVVTAHDKSTDRRGVGVLELLALGPHEPLGLRGPSEV